MPQTQPQKEATNREMNADVVSPENAARAVYQRESTMSESYSLNWAMMSTQTPRWR
jgi:hypothetical protein